MTRLAVLWLVAALFMAEVAAAQLSRTPAAEPPADVQWTHVAEYELAQVRREGGVACVSGYWLADTLVIAGSVMPGHGCTRSQTLGWAESWKRGQEAAADVRCGFSPRERDAWAARTGDWPLVRLRLCPNRTIWMYRPPNTRGLATSGSIPARPGARGGGEAGG